jgi:hypothetical protein
MATIKHQLLLETINASIRAAIRTSGANFGYVFIIGGMDDVLLTATNIPEGGVIQACEVVLAKLKDGTKLTTIRAS